MEEDIILLKDFIKGNYQDDKLEYYRGSYKMGFIYYKDLINSITNILNELERLQKEFELLDHECSRLEQKEIILESENEHYKELMYALETYYSIIEEDLEKCVKEDR